jgi:hypothetical protein
MSDPNLHLLAEDALNGLARLRAERADLQGRLARQIELVGALNELVGALTDHADALRATVLALVDQQAMPDDFWQATINAYDAFIKEA